MLRYARDVSLSSGCRRMEGSNVCQCLATGKSTEALDEFYRIKSGYNG
jgi:hypothetical protein